MEIAATDYHTAGEPFRIVAEGAVEIPGDSVLARREHASSSEDVERVRRLLATSRVGMPTCTAASSPPDDDGADFGVLFWHKDGYSTACGHGTIALGAWAVEFGRVEAPRRRGGRGHDRRPVRTVVARVTCRAGAVERVAFRNVPAT